MLTATVTVGTLDKRRWRRLQSNPFAPSTSIPFTTHGSQRHSPTLSTTHVRSPLQMLGKSHAMLLFSAILLELTDYNYDVVVLLLLLPFLTCTLPQVFSIECLLIIIWIYPPVLTLSSRVCIALSLNPLFICLIYVIPRPSTGQTWSAEEEVADDRWGWGSTTKYVLHNERPLRDGGNELVRWDCASIAYGHSSGRWRRSERNDGWALAGALPQYVSKDILN